MRIPPTGHTAHRLETTLLRNRLLRVRHRQVETGPIRETVVADLEALKWRLAAMESPDELPAEQAEAMRAEISAIRLHPKRPRPDRPGIAADLEVRLGLRPPPDDG